MTFVIAHLAGILRGEAVRRLSPTRWGAWVLSLQPRQSLPGGAKGSQASPET